MRKLEILITNTKDRMNKSVVRYRTVICTKNSVQFPTPLLNQKCVHLLKISLGREKCVNKTQKSIFQSIRNPICLFLVHEIFYPPPNPEQRREIVANYLQFYIKMNEEGSLRTSISSRVTN